MKIEVFDADENLSTFKFSNSIQRKSCKKNKKTIEWKNAGSGPGKYY